MIVVAIIIILACAFTFIQNRSSSNHSNKSTHRKMPVSYFEIDFYPVRDSFDCSGRPAYIIGCSYESFLDKATEWQFHIDYNSVIHKAIQELRNQEHQMIKLRDKVTQAVRRQDKLDDASYLYALLNSTFDAYKQNRADAIEAIRKCAQCDPNELDEWVVVTKDIANDNKFFIKELKKLADVMREQDAFIHKDDTVAHITDFTSLEKLRALNETLCECVIKEKKLEAETKNTSAPIAVKITGELHRAPTIEMPQKMSVRTLIGTDIPLQKQSASSESEPIDSNNSMAAGG